MESAFISLIRLSLKTYKVMKKDMYRTLLNAALLSIPTLMVAMPTMAQNMAQKPVLVITNEVMPASDPMQFSNGPVRMPEITANQISGADFFDERNTVVGGKVEMISKDLFALQARAGNLTNRLKELEGKARSMAAEYYASVATINTQLQVGTTPGNPRLIRRLDTAQGSLEALSQNLSMMNALGVETADAASAGSFLLEMARQTYSLSGAIEEDHARLSELEDQINNSIITIERLLNEVNSNISRTTAYINSEKNNIRTLALAVSSGNLFGRTLARNPYATAQVSDLMVPATFAPAPIASMPLEAPYYEEPLQMVAPAPIVAPEISEPRPLAKIRFDKSDVEYKQPLYVAVQDALQKYPNAKFDLIAVNPTNGNAAQVAIESTKARRNAEQVLRELQQMGLTMDQINLSYAPSADARTSEVHVYIR